MLNHHPGGIPVTGLFFEIVPHGTVVYAVSNAGSTEPEALRREIFNERRRELFGEGQYYFDIVRNGYYREMLRGKFKTLTDEEVRNGALYTWVSSDAFEKNTLMTQNTYWLWQK